MCPRSMPFLFFEYPNVTNEVLIALKMPAELDIDFEMVQSVIVASLVYSSAPIEELQIINRAEIMPPLRVYLMYIFLAM